MGPITRALLVVSVVFATFQVGTLVRAQQATQAPAYRSSIALVPIDVRVIDNKTGRPVTDLKRDDFTIFEDDARQEIRHFLLQRFDDGRDEPGAVAVSTPARLVPVVSIPPLSLAPQASRIFLIVLAHGRHEVPSKGLTALLAFLRTQLLPRDQVALLAYDRTTDFTTDHESIARVVERFKEENDAIKSQIDWELAGLAGVYGPQELSDPLQARIDRVFEGAGSYSLVGSAMSARTGVRTKRDLRKRLEDATDGVVAAGRATPASANGGDAGGGAAPQSWGSFDAFVADNVQTLRETGQLYAAIAYMRQLEGEKHLIYLSPGGTNLVPEGGHTRPTPAGLHLPRVDDYTEIARTAADARVTLDVVTGADDASENRLMRSLADETGGAASIAEYGQRAFDRVDAVMRAGYLLGYYPSNSNWRGEFRKVLVKVNRRGVTVLARNGYHAFKEAPTFDAREYTTRQRIDAGLAYKKDINDIGVKLDASFVREGGEVKANLVVHIDPAYLYFQVRNGIRLGQIDIAFVAMDQERETIGKTYKKVVGHLEYDAQTFALVKKNGIPVQVKLPVPTNTRRVRVVVYDYVFDLLGTSTAWVR